MKQTAVEWLVELVMGDNQIWREAINQAKEMEKEQIMDAWLDGTETKWDSNKYAEQYYKQTFKKDQ